MKRNEFSIHCDRERPPESPAEIAEKFLQTLDALSAINPHFRSWYIMDYVKMSGHSLERVRDNFTDIVENGVSRDGDGTPEPIYGYKVTAFNHDEKTAAGPFSVQVKARAGGKSLFSGVSFSTGFGIVPDPSIVDYPVIKFVLTTLVDIWAVTIGKVYSTDLHRCWDDPPFHFDLCWMTYLSSPLAAQITPPRGVVVERIGDGGLLLVATEETFDVSNPGHMAAAYAIRESLAPINDLPRHERAKQDSDELERSIKALGMPIKRVRSRDI
jgi:hypothetical protein